MKKVVISTAAIFATVILVGAIARRRRKRNLKMAWYAGGFRKIA